MSTVLQTAQEAINDYHEFQHAGVKGMKWGVRKSTYEKLEKRTGDSIRGETFKTGTAARVQKAKDSGKITKKEYSTLVNRINEKRPLNKAYLSKRTSGALGVVSGAIGGLYAGSAVGGVLLTAAAVAGGPAGVAAVAGITAPLVYASSAAGGIAGYKTFRNNAVKAAELRDENT